MRMDELMRVFRVKLPLTWTRIVQFINPSSFTKPNVRQWTMDLVTSAQKLQIASLARAPSSLPLSPLSLRGFLFGNVASAVCITLKRVLN